ncbi:DNA cytosine methyltransferase [Alcanivorax sp. JB21]|uniref:DNA cytosine methyltransferase n=1 Tax=Alcanivorax limicola TaxID=2874102 RepID=UPI001CBCCCD8|nr:DNA cytosine methyltransferase [Alcanivorax limicola]MBZ2187840.1 DNA cytosine methyltransferase [Alcanivorax limicola]
MEKLACVDLFCGAGGLTHGFVKEGLPVVAGIDMDPACRYPYEANNNARFIEADIASVKPKELLALYQEASVRILAGCAPCQPFSSYAQRYDEKRDGKWSLLYEFARLAKGAKPDVITMENVPKLIRHEVFLDFVATLEGLGYKTWFKVVDSTYYGVPQTRKRLVMLASRHGEICLEEPTHPIPKTLRQAIGRLMPLQAGEASPRDPMHVAATLTPLNLKRIKASRPGGTWRDWPKSLVADCHKTEQGKSFPSVYGRMEWDKPAPTMTTQCYGFGNGRFGHPDEGQHRAISLREAAIIQSFPKDYKFVRNRDDINFRVLGRLIGNAVPVGLGRAIARSIRGHLVECGLA